MQSFQGFFREFLLASVLVFALHVSVRAWAGLGLFPPDILWSYGVNMSLGLLLVYLVTNVLSERSMNVGWTFIGTSGLKFLFFFIVVWPEINRDQSISTSEFGAFFVPYTVCLFMELRFLAKRLNAL